MSAASPGATAREPLTDAVNELDWVRVATELDAQGWSVLGRLLPAAGCQAVISLYGRTEAFRSQVIMARHGYGRGEYKYFSYPLPAPVAALRTSLYPQLSPIANAWNERMGLQTRYPAEHAEFLKCCHEAGQTRPTPLLLKYEKDDYNCLHQDLYGEHVFPLQVAILLSDPGTDFGGGELVLTEQRPRMQSRPSVVSLMRGDAVVFASHQRPVEGSRGSYRVTMRHGVSKLHWGQRHTLGIIFHDALERSLDRVETLR